MLKYELKILVYHFNNFNYHYKRCVAKNIVWIITNKQCNSARVSIFRPSTTLLTILKALWVNTFSQEQYPILLCFLLCFISSTLTVHKTTNYDGELLTELYTFVKNCFLHKYCANNCLGMLTLYCSILI